MSLLTLATIHFFAVISPGPDMAIVIRNAVCFSRHNGLLTALGITIGNLILIGVCIGGASLLIHEYPQVLRVIQILGSLYLGWIGFQALRAFFKDLITSNERKKDWTSGVASRLRSFQDGLLTTLSNPKAIVYFVSVSSQFLRPDQDWHWSLGLVSIMISITLVWFSLVAFFIGHNRIREKFMQKQFLFNGMMGIVLLLFCVNNLMKLI